MLRSLSSRILALGATVALALFALVGVLLGASAEARESLGWVMHTQAVIDTLDTLMFDVREAESGHRGFLLTHDPLFARTFSDRTADAKVRVDHVIRLTADNPLQQVRGRRLAEAVDQRIASLRRTLVMGQQGRFAAAAAIVARGRGRELMEVVTI